MKFNVFLLSALTIPALTGNLQAERMRHAEVTREIKRLQEGILKQELQDQLIDVAIRTSRREGHGLLQKELASFLPEGTELKELKNLTPEQREHVLQSLSREAREMVCTELSTKLMGSSAEPFKIPTEAIALSQLDTFYLLVIELLGHDAYYHALTGALHKCLGVKVALDMQTQLNHDNVNAVIPASFKDKFFTENIFKLMIISNRIQKLASTYKK